MPNPLSFVKPALDTLSEGCKILPATGGAFEDLQHPDQEEVEDVLINREMGEITAFAETPEPSPTNIYRPTPPLHRREKHLFRFFIDGSLRTYFLATAVEGRRSFPVLLSQVGATIIKRNKEGRLSCLDTRHKVLLLLPKGGRGVSESLWTELQRLSISNELFELVDVTPKDEISGEDKADTDLRNKAGGKARYRMHQLEIELIETTDKLRDENSWLIIDGAVKLGDFIKAPYLIGVAKSFRKDPQFSFGRRRPDRKDITTILAGLPHQHRTAAFSSYDGQVAFWYVRLREQKEVDYPLMGVVKVEIPCPERKPVNAELADLISRALVAERNVTPYGCDRRWHALLYPIYVAEQAIKNRFFTQQVLTGAIKWPTPTL